MGFFSRVFGDGDSEENPLEGDPSSTCKGVLAEGERLLSPEAEDMEFFFLWINSSM